MIQTGIQKLDEFLSGGIRAGLVVDIFGGRGTGKSLLLLQLSINSVKNGGSVLYFDTTGRFRPERIVNIQKQTTSSIDYLQHITVSRPTNTSEQINSIQNLADDFSLIVIDNVTDLFSFEYKNDESRFEKNMLFMRYMHKLSEIALAKKIPIVITNMTRYGRGKEVENMQSVVDPFTHIKIHLLKNPPKFRAKAYWALDKLYFTYNINQYGLSSEAI